MGLLLSLSMAVRASSRPDAASRCADNRVNPSIRWGEGAGQAPNSATPSAIAAFSRARSTVASGRALALCEFEIGGVVDGELVLAGERHQRVVVG
jgi:hypothetical protein